VAKKLVKAHCSRCCTAEGEFAREPYFPHISLLKSWLFFADLLFSSVVDFGEAEQLDELTL